MMHAYAYANANAMQLRTKHLKCYSGFHWIGYGPAFGFVKPLNRVIKRDSSASTF
jgi:hypothetical protein